MGMMSTFRRSAAALFGFGGFDAASGHRRLRGFRPARAHVNVLLRAAGPEMNSRARWLIRNNGYAATAVESWAANVVGDGIKPNAKIKTASRKKAAQQLWLDWTDEADAEGLTDFYGIQRRVCREVFIAGECFVRFRPRRDVDGLTVPLQLQVLPAEMLPLDKNEELASGEIRQGIEFDAIGRRVAYHFYRRHPGETSVRGLAGETVRVPAEDVVHVIDPVEAGQLRGVSRFSAAIVKLFLLDQYDDAELDRKKVAALYALFVTSGLGEYGPLDKGDGGHGEGAAEAPVELSPGTIIRLDEGEDIKVSDPAESGNTYEPFQYRTLLQVAAALGIPYGYLSGDVARGNFANSRLMLLEFRRRVGGFQHGVIVYQLCRAVWARWMDTAVLSGALSLPGYERRRREYLRCEWLPPRWDWVDPQKDINAELAQIEAGLKSRTQAISERGYDAEQVDEEIAEDRRREARLGLDFRNGAEARQEPAGTERPDDDEDDPTDRPEDRG